MAVLGHEQLDEIRALWQGVCTVTHDLLTDLVAEACVNAVVHGDVALVVEDDGTRGADRVDAVEGREEGRGGLGSAVLRASCTRFALRRSEEGSVLSASIPFG